MAPPSSRKSKRSANDTMRFQPVRGSCSPQDSTAAVQHLIEMYKDQVLSMVLATVSEDKKHALPCPFQRRSPMRYSHVKDPACNGRGFKDIADLRQAP